MLQERAARALRHFLMVSADWIRIDHGRGPAEVERVYRDTLAGRVSPDAGHILSLR